MHTDPENKQPIDIEELRKQKYEKRDADIPRIFKSLMLYFAFAIFCIVGTWVGFVMMKPEELALKPSQPEKYRLPQNMRLQTNITAKKDLEDLIKKHKEESTTYAWVDKNKNTVRIPVDSAIKIVLKRGLPTREGATTDAWPSGKQKSVNKNKFKTASAGGSLPTYKKSKKSKKVNI